MNSYPILELRESGCYCTDRGSTSGTKETLQDLNLVMEDGSWIHFEFQSKNEGLEGLKDFVYMRR